MPRIRGRREVVASKTPPWAPKYLFIISIIMVLVLIISPSVVPDISIDSERSSRQIVYTFFLYVVPSVLSLAGYYLLIKKEKDLSFSNAIGVVAALALFILAFSDALAYALRDSDPFSSHSWLFTVVLLVWFGMLFDRVRYLR